MEAAAFVGGAGVVCCIVYVADQIADWSRTLSSNSVWRPLFRFEELHSDPPLFVDTAVLMRLVLSLLEEPPVEKLRRDKAGNSIFSTISDFSVAAKRYFVNQKNITRATVSSSSMDSDDGDVPVEEPFSPADGNDEDEDEDDDGAVVDKVTGEAKEIVGVYVSWARIHASSTCSKTWKSSNAF